ncbi:tRNA (adenine-N(1)-)-methyltransferase catalytic subunit trm61 [Mortierella alpina]|uniref:tRNA (adenine(58)-N(1))-methyltransferase catalytic subunit TRM61 n=1 Tax=Mortierella alpina TaxID=64518 RepID=A0A9P6LY12_MORAP|nr:tRNA (adenine-N(1)-)-methyltransferase catalytic subunit trm61 [Mortierella alpina]
MSDTMVEKQSFARYKTNNTIEEGDLVVTYLNRETMGMIRVRKGEYFNCKFGSYKHADMIGLEYGTKLGSNTGRGFLYLLHPTPELWTLVLPHRTQILYIADISFVMNFLNLKPGMSMIESGTGSGSFSHSIARTLAPTGHLYTFEYHQERVNAAKKEFEEHGLSDMVTLQCRDVCKDGFDMENKVDAIFLDLPAPWEAVASAKKAFKHNKIGKICTFSPCIEQISRTVTALSEQGFVDIQMFECLIRFNEIRVIPMWTIEEAMEKQRAVEKKRKRDKPQAASKKNGKRQERRTQEDTEEESSKDKVAKLESLVDDSNDSSAAATPMSTSGSEAEPSSATSTPVVAPEATMPSATTATTTTTAEAEPRERIDPKNVVVTRLPAEQRGHTSYLMFATFTPAFQQPSLREKKAAEAQS